MTLYFGEIKDIVDESAKKIEALEDENVELEDMIDDLNDEIAELKAENESLRSDCEALFESVLFLAEEAGYDIVVE